MTDAPKPERKRWKAPEPKPRAPRLRPVFADEDNRIAYAQWLVGCGMEARAAARQAAKRDLADVERVLRTVEALRKARAAEAGPR